MIRNTKSVRKYENNIQRVNLDNAATSPIKDEVKKAILPYLTEKFGNPSSIHGWGQEARMAIDASREKVAKFLNCQNNEIVFTSGGTESDNLAVRGVIEKYWENGKQLKESGKWFRNQKIENSTDIQSPISIPISNFSQPISIPHIITSQIEHHAILKTCENLEKIGQAEVTYLKPNHEGIIETEKVKKAIKKNTVLISIMYVNNEIGTIQPIREIGKLVESENRNRLKESGKQLGNQKIENRTDIQFSSTIPISNFNHPISRIYFHTDAVQATQYLPMNVDFLHVDLLTISGHKIGAPKGIGGLYIRKGTPLTPLMHGGEQEANRRAGTENVAGIVALGKAIELLSTNFEVRKNKTKKLRDYFINRVLKEIPEVELNGSKENRSPNNANFYFKYIEGESILLSLDLVGIAASSGSACTSLSLSPSHVLMAVYKDPERSHGSVRFTLSDKTTKAEIDYTILKLKEIIQRLRAISPLYKRPAQGRGRKEKND